MKYFKYDVFLKVLELNSMTKAAVFFGYTQSAVSQMVTAFEKELGIRLLIRSRSGLSLSAEGEQLLPYIRDICDSSAALSEKVMDLKGICTGMIRIGSFHSIACYMLTSLIKEFKVLYPNVEFELIEGDFTEIEDTLKRGLIDVGFLAVEFITHFDVIKLKKDELKVLLPLDHPRAKDEFYPLEEIVNEDFINLNEGTYNDRDIVFNAMGIHPEAKYYSREDNTIISMVENGLGVSILPDLVMSRCPFHVAIKKTRPSFHRTLGAILRDRKKASNAVRRFLEFCQERIADEG